MRSTPWKQNQKTRQKKDEEKYPGQDFWLSITLTKPKHLPKENSKKKTISSEQTIRAIYYVAYSDILQVD